MLDQITLSNFEIFILRIRAILSFLKIPYLRVITIIAIINMGIAGWKYCKRNNIF